MSYAIAVGGVRYIALIAHSNCGMVNLSARRDQFVHGLVQNAGWQEGMALEHFHHYAPLFEIGNEIEFVLSETNRLRKRYPAVTIAPLYYSRPLLTQ